MEMVVNWYVLSRCLLLTVSDLVIASERASFALPEVKRGVFAKAGALGRIIRYIGTLPPFLFLIFLSLPIPSCRFFPFLSPFHFDFPSDL